MTTNKSTTAVEWLVSQYEQTIGKSITSVMLDEIAKAKQMEKEQIETAWCEGNESEPKEVTMNFAKKYYTQTYQAFKGELIQDEIGNLIPKKNEQ